ncbi:hypothetical protein VHEMI10190 [[Torrubiella] hemipterigena]|uniref:Kinetoplast-associated protein KAP n=1 Tax=[Torrubiella] hemipterigena TaxID=1531966 RepID=A0A0A1TRS9_9HYPO|nr:hypothetical protein VHEMI10190 [[Torrubiella] hemipterigena]
MATTPLSPSADEALNCPTPASSKRYGGQYEVQSFRKLSVDMDSIDEASSPINLETTDVLNMSDQENLQPSRRSHSRVISGTELSPLKILNRKRSSPDSGLADLGAMPPPPLRCVRRVSPEKRFPVKVSGSGDSFAALAEHQRKVSLESLLQGNDALKQAIDIFEDELSAGDNDNDNDALAADETMMSTFSTFSAMPDLATLSKLGHSPAKLSGLRGIPPRVPSATGSRPSTRDEANSSNLLMDYTDSLRNPRRSPDKRGTLPASFSTNHNESTPNRKTLMDFDIPPMPTPRSVPSISAREVESLKSSFMSEISSLKASLSGKEAEVRSLKSAVGDAEKRVGETMEQFRDEQALKEQLSHEKEDWENRSRELERVLSQARNDIEASHQEREDLEQKLDESEKRREAAETLHQEAESKIAGMRAGKSSERTSLDNNSNNNNRHDPASTNKEVEVAVERVARELHALYKGKHETKVAALKKSYEARWEKKIRELEARIGQLTEENQLLEANVHSPIHTNSNASDELKAQTVRDSATIKELHADVQRLEAVAASTRKDNEELHLMLERERVEKGELVQLAEELMSIQNAPPPQIPARADRSVPRTVAEPVMPAKTPAKTPRRSDVRASMGRASGLRTPGSSLRQPQDRMRASAPPARQSLGGSRASLGGSSARAGVMANIERMAHRRDQI